ncbi:MAG: GGDEF domain-containing protein [Erysipelotrichaceae bacterium]|nr:GGDEF domain-containing protein [Erysipelotrichaceae bacterium]
MNPVLEYFIQNWALVLILLAFAIMLWVTIFLDRKTVRRMYILIVFLFLLSICVYTEFRLAETKHYPELRLAMMAIRYSATPVIVAFIIFTLVKRARWYVFLPVVALTVLNVISIWTGIVFGLDANGELVRGALGYFPYIAVGIYSFFLVFILIRQSNKQAVEIVPIAFLAFTFASGLVFPFVMGKEYSKIFCSTIAVGLFVYYVFSILQLTTKDALTGLLNRQAYYSFVRKNSKDITAIVSIDMNGLKTINDNQGHLAGDEALTTLALCFTKATKNKQYVYRIGGDEFVIVCKKTSKADLKLMIKSIKENVAETEYSCSIGYSFAFNGEKTPEEMAKESDAMMYAHKAKFYSESSNNRRLQ